MELNKETYSRLLSQGVDIATNASLTLKAVSLGGSVTESKEVSDSFKNEMSTAGRHASAGSAAAPASARRAGRSATRSRPSSSTCAPSTSYSARPSSRRPRSRPRRGKGSRRRSPPTSRARRSRARSPCGPRPSRSRSSASRSRVRGEIDRIAELTGTLAIRGFVPNGRSELPGEPVVWSADSPEAVKDGTSYFLQARGAPARRFFAVAKDDVTRGGYAVVEANLAEKNAGAEMIGGDETQAFGPRAEHEALLAHHAEAARQHGRTQAAAEGLQRPLPRRARALSVDSAVSPSLR